MSLHVGCIGIGLMGEAMARRLLDRGHRVTAWNLEPERLDTIRPHGAEVAESPAAVARAADCVLMCVLHTEAVANCVFGPGGVIEAGEQPGKIVVDVSTIEPDATRNMARRLRDAISMAWIDAPASGGTQAAREGTLTLMLGGAAQDIATAMPLLIELGAGITHMGPVGAGQTTKVINQAIVGSGFILMAEALALAEAAGLDTAKLPDALAGGFADSALLRHRYPRMQQRNFDPPTGYARQLNKDMQAVQAFAQGVGATLPLVATAARQFADFVAAGNDLADASSIIRLYRPD